MKKIVLALIISLVGIVGVGEMPGSSSLVYAQKKDEKKKDPPGRPVVRDKGDKGRDDKPKPPPKKGKKPEDD
jgi:hypothetical protein